MKPISYRPLLVLGSLLIFVFSCLPSIGQVLTLKSGSVINKGILRGQVQEVQVNNPRGKLQWQQSADGINWLIWTGKTDTSVLVAVNQNLFLRCAIKEANCDPVYSDVLKLIPYDLATVTTTTVTEIQKSSALSGGNIVNDGGDPIRQKGICWSLKQNPTTIDHKTIDGEGTASYSSALTGLSSGTQYFVRAYATNSGGTAYGNQVSFTTSFDISLPTVLTSTINSINRTSAAGGGNVLHDGKGAVTARGLCYSTSQNPTVVNNKTTDGSGIGVYTSNLTNLTSNTTYFVRAYATNSAGSGYGEQVSFTTLQNIVLPTVTTTTFSDITQTTATSGGNVTSDGGATVTIRGLCWSTNQNPTTSDFHSSNGTGIGAYISNLSGLTSNTTYYARAYATNSAGSGYGEQVSFTTLRNIVLPIVTTAAFSAITQTTATSGGNVTSDGGATVTIRGLCWSTNQNPTTSDFHTSDGTGTGMYISNLASLTANTRYYARAYATNSAGTSYGDEVNFSTLPLPPSITTTEVTDITQVTATSGGNITDDGGSEITVRGVCWSTVSNPTIYDIKTTDGTGTGSFSSSLTGLTANTTYFVRAYASNNVGTAYGNEVSFTTLQNIGQPVVTTANVSAIAQTIASSGGNVISDGGEPVTARGICWSTSHNPNTTDFYTSNGTGTGIFTSNLNTLIPNTLYYVRAYATNNAGTGYGDEVSFTTKQTVLGVPTITTVDISNITQTSAVACGTLVSFGDSDITGLGFCYSTSPNPTTANWVLDLGLIQFLIGYLDGLTGNTTYYIRAFASNSYGIAYGKEISFKTKVSDSEISKKVVVLDGDSRALGFNCSYLYPIQPLLRFDEPVDFYNAANGGLSTAEFIAKGNVDPHFTSSAPINIAVMWAGSIDVAHHKFYLPAIVPYNNLVTYCNMRKAKGWKVIICTEISVGGTGPNGVCDVVRAELNDLIRTNWTTFADGLADFGANPSIGSSGAYSNTTFYCDELHLTNTGTTVVADVISRAVNLLLK